ncbi:glutamine amidotransferase [Roseimaritima ulvae]|uniref:Putative glutamine amidotransferase domain-containing protein n=1 Tax=Roseimaritima ulvae TaxID=980254 RepID=A0A5B9QS27_9BACT|nr:glutamine amidotransferase [Roseimaritima ulvae]QEG41794.1 hypothetical protein UC8_38200 [Roseimaritima ulvae]
MQLSWDPIYTSPWLVAVLAGVMFALLMLVRPEHDSLSPKRRRTLLCLRGIAGLVLVLAMLRPSLIKTDDQPAPATLAVLLDGTRSMTLPAGDGRDRWTVQRNVWDALAPALQQQDQMLEVQILSYDEAVRPQEFAAVGSWLEQPPEGAETDIAGALRGALARAAGRPLAGVVLAGDGTQTAKIEGAGAQQVARTLASLEVPLWSVPIGPRGGDDTQRDVEVDGVPDHFLVFSGNTFSLSATVRTQSLVGAEVPVRIRLVEQLSGAETGPAEEVAIRSVVPRSQSDSQAVEFSLTAPPPGRYRMEVVADEQAGEALTINNQQVSFLDVREGGGRIVFLEGEPREEQLRLRLALRRFPDLELLYRWIRRDGQAGWPVDLETVLAKNQFDIYIIGDLHSDALGDAQLQQLKQRVADGAGLLMLGGLNTFDAGGYADTPLADALPIRMDRSLARPASPDGVDAAQLPGPLKIRVARSHPVVRLNGNQEPQQTFDALAPLTGANRLADVRAIPGVQVLLESEDEDPLLVIGEYGKGRVVAFAGDSTWQWWRQGDSALHRRFWRQIMLWLLAREALSDDAISVELDVRRFASSDTPSFRIRGRTSDEAAAALALGAELIAADGTRTALPVSPRPTAAGESIVGGKLPVLPPGLYRLRGFQTEPAGGGSLEPDEIAFQVIESDRELLRPLADPAFLEQLSALTATAGGRAFAADQVDQLIDAIRTSRQQAVSPITEKKRLGDDPASGWLLFLVFSGLLIGEWVLRRRWGLV